MGRVFQVELHTQAYYPRTVHVSIPSFMLGRVFDGTLPPTMGLMRWFDDDRVTSGDDP